MASDNTCCVFFFSLQTPNIWAWWVSPTCQKYVRCWSWTQVELG